MTISFGRMQRECFVIAASALIALGVPVAAHGGWKEGDPLPNLAGYGLEGALPSVSTGRVVLVDFCASWCGPCKASFPVLQDLHTRFAPRGLVVLAVSVDDNPAALQRFLKENPVTFPVVRDATQRLVKESDVQGMPTSFLVDAAGRIRHVHAGFHGKRTAQQYEAEIEALLKERSVNP